jgi:hypothetical protein
VIKPAASNLASVRVYPLSSSSVRLSDWPDSVRKKLPR